MALIEATMAALDAAGTGYVKTSYTTLASTVLPTAKIFFGISIAWYGLQGMLGISQFSLDVIFKRLGIMALIVVGLSGWPFFEQFFYNIVIKTPEQIGNALFKGFVGGKAATATSGLQVAWDTGFEAVQAAFAQGGINSLGAFLVAGLLALAVIFFTVVAFVIIAFGKMFAYVLLAIAPLFIILLAFEWTRKWFDSYINALFHVIVLLIVTYSVIGFMLGMADGTVKTLQGDAKNATESLMSIAPFLFYMVLGGLAFTQVPSLAGMLASGTALNVGHAWAFSKTIGAASAASRYAGRSVQSTYNNARNAARETAALGGPTTSSAKTAVGRSVADTVYARRIS